MSNKYVLECDHGDPVAEDFLQIVTAQNRDHMIFYTKQPSGNVHRFTKPSIRHNNITFNNYSQFLDHIDLTK